MGAPGRGAAKALRSYRAMSIFHRRAGKALLKLIAIEVAATPQEIWSMAMTYYASGKYAVSAL